MKLLTETEKGVLQGNTAGLELPAGARIYLGQGVPTVFRLAGVKADAHHPDGWLHIPGEMLASIRQNLIVQGSNLQFSHVAQTGIEADDVILYPVLISGQVRALIAVGADSKLDLDQNTRDAVLVALLSRYTGEDREYHPKLLGDFLGCLFDRDRSYDEFQKTVLELMTRQWPGTLGAVYFESEGVHKLRLAVGDIHLSDRLESTLKSSTALQWSEAVRRQQFFVPADMTPNYPVVAGHPPNYMFVHPGIISDRTEYMMVVVMPGDIGIPEVAALRQIAQLAGHIHESQFSTASEVLTLYARLKKISTSAAEFKTALVETFRVVRHQLELSRMVVVSDAGPAVVVAADNEGEPAIRTEPASPIADILLDNLKATGPLLVRNVRREPRLADLLESYRDHDVSSEIIFALGTPADALSYVAFGSPLTGDYLKSHRRLLMAVVQFLSLCHLLRMRGEHRETVIGGTPSYDSIKVANDRLNTVAKLAGGYFHDLMEHLSVVVGQNEIIESAIIADDTAFASRVILSGSSKVQKAADRIAAYLRNLRELCLLTTDRLEQRVSYRRLFEDLPTIVSGHARQVKDNKNVVLAFETRPSRGDQFKLTYRQLYDYVLPFVLGLMDEAIASGTMTVSAASHEAEAPLVFEFPADTIGHIGLGEMLGRTYSHRRFESHGKDDGVVHFEDAELRFGMSSERICRIVISFAQPTQDSAGNSEDASFINKGEGVES